MLLWNAFRWLLEDPDRNIKSVSWFYWAPLVSNATLQFERAADRSFTLCLQRIESWLQEYYGKAPVDMVIVWEYFVRTRGVNSFLLVLEFDYSCTEGPIRYNVDPGSCLIENAKIQALIMIFFQFSIITLTEMLDRQNRLGAYVLFSHRITFRAAFLLRRSKSANK